MTGGDDGGNTGAAVAAAAAAAGAEIRLLWQRKEWKWAEFEINK